MWIFLLDIPPLKKVESQVITTIIIIVIIIVRRLEDTHLACKKHLNKETCENCAIKTCRYYLLYCECLNVLI